MTVSAYSAHAGNRPLDAGHGIVADIEMIGAEEINAAYERMLAGQVKYRFVIDSVTLKA